MADQVLLQGVQGITDLITTPGLINLDFADVKSVMTERRLRPHGHRLGPRRGPRRRGRRAGDLQPAARGLASTAPTASCSPSPGGSDLGLFEINEAAALVVHEAAHPEANIIFGAVIDDALGDEVRVTVIAAGFDGGGPTQRHDDRALGTGHGTLAAGPAAASGRAGPAQAQPQQTNGVAQPAPQQVHPAPVQHQRSRRSSRLRRRSTSSSLCTTLRRRRRSSRRDR